MLFSRLREIKNYIHCNSRIDVTFSDDSVATFDSLFVVVTIIFSDQQWTGQWRKSESWMSPEKLLDFRENSYESSPFPAVFFFHSILYARRFFPPSSFFFLSSFLAEKAFSSPPLPRDLRLLRGSSRIRASPHPPCENKGGRDARRNLE